MVREVWETSVLGREIACRRQTPSSLLILLIDWPGDILLVILVMTQLVVGNLLGSFVFYMHQAVVVGMQIVSIVE